MPGSKEQEKETNFDFQSPAPYLYEYDSANEMASLKL